jgi:glycosyltransferase involved in cell wall biosynthesis
MVSVENTANHTDANHTDAARPRLLLVIGSLSIGGGAEKVAATIGSELTARGYEVHLLTFYEATQRYPYTGIYHSAGEEIIHNRIRKIFRIPSRIRLIQRYAKDHNIDLAISFLEEANFYTILAKLCGHFKLPVVVSVRNNIERREWLFKVATRFLYKAASKVVSVTRAVEEVLRTRYRAANTTTIYNPLDMSLIDAKKVEPLPEEYKPYFATGPVCITIGRLIPQKGQWHLVRAFTKVRETHPNATLVVLGEGELREKLTTLRDNCDLTDAVHFIGIHENVYQFLAAADLFVFSSLWEGMPNTLLEALAVGLPIIAPDCVSGPREIIAPTLGVTKTVGYPHETDLGILVEPQTDATIWQPPHVVPILPKEDALAEGITRGLTRVQNEKWNVPDYGRAPFSLANITDEWETLVRQIHESK